MGRTITVEVPVQLPVPPAPVRLAVAVTVIVPGRIGVTVEVYVVPDCQLAARWAITQDPSDGFRQELLGALRYLGVEDAGLGD